MTDQFPLVKGWIPFKSVGTEHLKLEQKLSKEKLKDNYKNNGSQSQLVDVPKGWKTPAFLPEDNPHKRLFAETEFKVKFSKALEKYLKEVFPIAQKAIGEHKIKAQLILNEAEMIVTTTRNTFDPVMIIRSHSVIRLLARYVPVEDAITVLEDDIYEDIINIGHPNKETFQRRRNRLSDSSILDLIKELLDCKVFISGKTVAAIGSYSNLDKLRSIVLDCFDRNIHPIFNLKRLQVINQLKSMPEMEGKDWSSYLPLNTKKNVKRKKPQKIHTKKEYCAFPPAPVETKIDKELADGTFHLKYQKDKNKSYYSLIDKDKTKEEEKKKMKEEFKKKNQMKEEKTVSETTEKKRKRTPSDEKDEPQAKKTKKIKEDKPTSKKPKM